MTRINKENTLHLKAIFSEQTNLHEIKSWGLKKGLNAGNMLDIVSLVRYEKKKNSSGTCCAATMYVWTDVSACDHWKLNHIWKTLTLSMV